MKLSVIFADNRIVKDGLGYVVTLPDEPEIWAIQWGGSAGHIEYRDAETLNEGFTDADVIAPYLTLWQAAHDAATFVPEPTLSERKAALTARVNAVRDERMSGGFDHGGHRFQSQQSDRENIVRKGDRADKAIDSGAAEDDLTWDVTTDGQPFAWIAADNTLVPMDAFEMTAMRDAGERFKQATTFFARAYKDAILAAANHGVLDAMEAGIETGEVGPFTGWPA